MCRAYAALDLPPIVRITAPDPYQACMVLDGGAAGVVAPYVETAEEVRRLAGAVKYRPLKGRSLRNVLDGKGFPEGRTEAYLARNNAGSVLIVNIESTPAIENLDDAFESARRRGPSAVTSGWIERRKVLKRLKS